MADSVIEIPTVGGSVSASGLGRTLMHEHVFTLTPEMNQNYPETWGDEDARVEKAIRELEAAKDAGIDTIVDLTAIGLGRYIPRIQRVAAGTRVNIVVCTGIYTLNDVPPYFFFRSPEMMGGEDIMVDYFVRDIEDGIGDTGVRAGILKCATHSAGMTEGVQRVLRAVAKAHRRTGVPISTHTFDAPNGTDQQNLLEEEGVDLSRVVIGHVDYGSRNLDYVEEMLSRGSYVGFDQFGFHNPHAGPFAATTPAQRAERIAELCRRGYGSQVVLSHDHNCYCDFAPHNISELFPDDRYTFLPTDGTKLLRDAGLSDEQIQALFVDNPRRVFETTARGAY